MFIMGIADAGRDLLSRWFLYGLCRSSLATSFCKKITLLTGSFSSVQRNFFLSRINSATGNEPAMLARSIKTIKMMISPSHRCHVQTRP
jgi:hypothetical protein